MPVICIILLSFLAIFAFFGLIFLLCKYIDQTGKKFVKKIQEEQAGYYFCQLEAIRKKKEKEKLISCLNSQETERRKKKGEKPCTDLLEKEERKEGNKEQKKEEKKPSSGLSKTIPRSYSTTLPGFNNVRRRSSDTYSDLLHTTEWRDKREKILKRDNYRCVYCGRRHAKLHVHHKYYSAYPNGVLVDPWNYPDDALITLCAYCHQRVHTRKKIKVYHRRYTDNY